MRTNLSALAIVLLAAAPLSAQTATRVALTADSRVTIDGTSTLHSFTCRTSDLDATITLDAQLPARPLTSIDHPLEKASLKIPVASLRCGESKMDSNLQKALKAKTFPQIEFSVMDYTLGARDVALDKVTIAVNGSLTIAGVTRPVTFDVATQQLADGSIAATGQVRVKMSDFGVKPPSFFMGTMKVGDHITVKFAVTAQATPAVAVLPER